MSDKLHVPRERIMYGHVGNGLIIWISETNMTIAHIAPDRTVKVYCDVSDETLVRIIEIAKTNDSTISATQDTKVFDIPPIKDAKYVLTASYVTPSYKKYTYTPVNTKYNDDSSN